MSKRSKHELENKNADFDASYSQTWDTQDTQMLYEQYNNVNVCSVDVNPSTSQTVQNNEEVGIQSDNYNYEKDNVSTQTPETANEASLQEANRKFGEFVGQELDNVPVLNLPEDTGEGLGFRLTRTQWDPYPWVRSVAPGSRAAAAGLRPGDCVLQAHGRDLLGVTVGQVASMIRGDGEGHGVSLLVWSCGVDPRDDPELLWSCGGAARGERARRALEGAVRALACCVCAATAVAPLVCARSHLYCQACWARLERCAMCREALPPKDSPYARNLVAEQVFEAIAIEYEIKDSIKQKPTQTASARTSPNRSPNMSSATNRKGRYQLSMLNKKKTVQFSEKFGQNYASDPNIHRSSETQEFAINRQIPRQPNSTTVLENSGPSNTSDDSENGGKHQCCHKKIKKTEKAPEIPKIHIEDTTKSNNRAPSCQNVLMQHRLVTRLRPACSLADLQNSVFQTCAYSQSLNNINLGESCKGNNHTGSLDDLKTNKCNPVCESPLLVLAPQPIYVLACEHSH